MKRRLFISNIMMLVVPVILSLAVAAAMTAAFMAVLGVKVDDWVNGGAEWFKDGGEFYRIMDRMDNLSEKFRGDDGFETIKAEVDGIAAEYSDSKSLGIAVFLDGGQIYAAGDFTVSPVITAALSEQGSNYYTANDMCVYASDAGKYKIVASDKVILAGMDYQLYRYFNNSASRKLIKNVGGIIFVAVIAIILATNRILTRMVYKSVEIPLGTLIYGVNQIRDGNLGYRINYSGSDEFAAVCSDFDEMAERLGDMAGARRKDEENRRELIAGISHDLRTPLTAIKTYAEGIEMGLASTPETQKRYIETIKNKTKDLEYIVNQLFLFSKLDLGEFPMRLERIDVGEWLSGFIKGISDEYLRKGLLISLTECEKGIMADADGVQFGNVLINIFENSVKYGNKERKTANVSCRLEGNAAVISVSDNGPGASRETLEKMFGVFYRGDKSRTNTGQGSGLGLAISAKIIERLGGGIRAVNLPEGGLCVTITIPAARI